MEKNTVSLFIEKKRNCDKITMLTAYDYCTARLMDSAGIDCLLVGDSLGMVMLGYENTLSVTLEDMIHHTKAVASGAKRAFVLADMPFMSYQQSVYDAVVSAGRLVKEARAQAVKLEGGAEFCPQIEAITQASIPVVAHLGLMPQSVNKIGGYRGQCREYESAKKLVYDAIAVQKSGAVALVLECVPADLAAFVTKILEIPTIGIGAGPGCDGQVLVYQDMLAMHDFRPKFVKVYENIGLSMKEAFERYIIDVKNSAFPSDEHFSSGGDSFELDVLPRLKSEYEVKKGGVACDDGGC